MVRKYSILIIALIVISYVTGYAMTSLVKQRITDELIQAFDDEDLEAIEQRVNWSALRTSLIEIMEDKGTSESSKNYQLPEESLYTIEEIVDYHLQPENIEILFHLKSRKYPNQLSHLFVKDVGYAPLSGFYIEVGRPQRQNKIKSYYDFVSMRLYFELDGLTYKVTEMQLPASFLPKTIYEESAIEFYIR